MTARTHSFLAALGLVLFLPASACSVGLLNEHPRMLADQGNQANQAFDGPMPVGIDAWIVRSRFGEILKENPGTDAEWIWEMHLWEKEREMEQEKALNPRQGGQVSPQGLPSSKRE